VVRLSGASQKTSTPRKRPSLVSTRLETWIVACCETRPITGWLMNKPLNEPSSERENVHDHSGLSAEGGDRAWWRGASVASDNRALNGRRYHQGISLAHAWISNREPSTRILTAMSLIAALTVPRMWPTSSVKAADSLAASDWARRDAACRAKTTEIATMVHRTSMRTTRCGDADLQVPGATKWTVISTLHCSHGVSWRTTHSAASRTCVAPNLTKN
jgi:hypothetical protein